MKKTYLYAGTTILFWSTIAVVGKMLLTTLNNVQLLWASSFFAAVSLLFINIITGNIKTLKSFKLKDYITLVLIGLPGTFFYYIFYYAGADILPASQAFIINYMWPMMSVIFACIILKEKLTFRKIIAIIISFLGVSIVAGADLAQFNKETILGAAFCFLGAVSYGIFTALNQKMNYDKRISIMISYFSTFILTTIINFANGNLFVPTLLQTIGFAWNGMLTMALATTLWAIVLEKGNTAKISNLAYITPFLSLVWTFLILGEEITSNSVIGLIIIVGGIFVQLKEQKN